MILAYDLASTTGVTAGNPCTRPFSWHFKMDGVHREKFAALSSAVRLHLRKFRPDVVAFEAPFVGPRGSAAKLLFGFRAVLIVECARCGIETVERTPSDIRKHFIGHGGGKRSQAKKAVLARCRELGWDVSSDDEADAAALWDMVASMRSDEHSKMTMEIGDGRSQR